MDERLKRLTSVERRALVLLLAHLAEFDRRKLYADRGHPSLFAYCTSELGYSEQGAYKRIQAARAVRDHPTLLDHLAGEKINLATIVVLAPHLTPDNVGHLLDSARGLPIREIEKMVARSAPQPDAPDILRALPAASPRAPQPHAPLPPPPSASAKPLPTQDSAGTPVPKASHDGPPDLLEPLSDRRYLFRFSGGEALRLKLEKSAALLRLGLRTGTMEIIFAKSLDELLRKIDPVRRQARRRRERASPSSRGRRIPSSLRDEVWTRDQGRCTFIGSTGRRCPAKRWLEIDHVVPFSRGGRSDDPSNLRLLCRAHNQLAARLIFGAKDYPRG